MTTSTQYGNILLACEAATQRESSTVVPVHVLGFILSGSILIEMGGKRVVRGEGEYGVLRGNQLGRFVKQLPARRLTAGPTGASATSPAPAGTFKAVNILMDAELLTSFSLEYGIKADRPYTGEPMRELEPNLLMDNFFRGFTPYFEPENKMGKALVNLKVKEAIHLLLHVAPEMKDLLFDFWQPGKIDLEDFMQKNYMHNVPMSRFAQLSGRSLSAFKTDFDKVFGIAPGRWLLERRLSEAFLLIREKGQRASDIYLDLGFEDLSHFSFAFKKQFGIPPSQLIQ